MLRSSGLSTPRQWISNTRLPRRGAPTHRLMCGPKPGWRRASGTCYVVRKRVCMSLNCPSASPHPKPLRGGITVMKKLDSRSRVTKKTVPAAKSRDTTADLRQQLEDLTEKFDLVLPEVTARVAALEHLLREKNLVSRHDLISARAFVRLQEE